MSSTPGLATRPAAPQVREKKRSQNLVEAVGHNTVSAESNVEFIKWIERKLPGSFKLERVEYRDARGRLKVNLIAKRGADADIGLALLGHTDCFPLGEWEAGARLTVEGDRLIGRGVSDAKGFVVLMLEAAEHAELNDLPLQLIFTADEESDKMGIEYLLEGNPDLFIAPRIVIGEPTNLEPVYGTPGYGAVILRVFRLDGQRVEPSEADYYRVVEDWLGRLSQARADLPERDDFEPPRSGINPAILTESALLNQVPVSQVIEVRFAPLPDAARVGFSARIQDAVNAAVEGTQVRPRIDLDLENGRVNIALRGPGGHSSKGNQDSALMAASRLRELLQSQLSSLPFESRLVADRQGADLWLEFRPLPKQHDELKRRIQETAIATERATGLRVEVEDLGSGEGFLADPESPLIQHLAAVSGTQPATRPYQTEASVVARYSVFEEREIAVWSHGDPNLIHKEGEETSRRQMRLAADGLLSTVNRFGPTARRRLLLRAAMLPHLPALGPADDELLLSALSWVGTLQALPPELRTRLTEWRLGGVTCDEVIAVCEADGAQDAERIRGLLEAQEQADRWEVADQLRMQRGMGSAGMNDEELLRWMGRGHGETIERNAVDPTYQRGRTSARVVLAAWTGLNAMREEGAGASVEKALAEVSSVYRSAAALASLRSVMVGQALGWSWPRWIAAEAASGRLLTKLRRYLEIVTQSEVTEDRRAEMIDALRRFGEAHPSAGKMVELVASAIGSDEVARLIEQGRFRRLSSAERDAVILPLARQLQADAGGAAHAA